MENEWRTSNIIGNKMEAIRNALHTARAAMEAAFHAARTAHNCVEWAEYYTDECIGCASGAEHGHHVLHPTKRIVIYHPRCSAKATVKKSPASNEERDSILSENHVYKYKYEFAVYDSVTQPIGHLSLRYSE